MMIYKYMTNKALKANVFQIPRGAQFVSVAIKKGEPVSLYFMVDTKETSMESRTFEVWGTGDEIPAGKRMFLGTVVERETYVWHVFERLDR